MGLVKPRNIIIIMPSYLLAIKKKHFAEVVGCLNPEIIRIMSLTTVAPPNFSLTKSPVSKPTPGRISWNTVSLDTLPDVIDR